MKPYKNTAEMVADINSPQYASDANFRAYVESRMAGGKAGHGGREVGNSGTLDFGKGGSNVGGFSVMIGSDHRQSGGVTSTSVDPTLVYSGNGFRSVAEMTDAFTDPRYSRDPAYRAAVASEIIGMELPPDGQLKV